MFIDLVVDGKNVDLASELRAVLAHRALLIITNQTTETVARTGDFITALDLRVRGDLSGRNEFASLESRVDVDGTARLNQYVVCLTADV